MSDEAKPFSKSAQLARGTRRYRRKVASAKQWQRIIAAKHGPCRACGHTGFRPPVFFHHLIPRAQGGDDTEDNIVPLCEDCHAKLHNGDTKTARRLTRRLSLAEFVYVRERL